ncbi:hypothetical protein FA95DRAFT_1477608, partial [Auriscalpium vulgare]
DTESMSAARRALRQQRNSLLPAARIPPEILRTIFAFCSEVDEPQMHSDVHSFGWLAVTYVCRRWRDVALAHAGLWTHVSFALGPVWADVFAARAQKMPLIVHF